MADDDTELYGGVPRYFLESFVSPDITPQCNTCLWQDPRVWDRCRASPKRFPAAIIYNEFDHR